MNSLIEDVSLENRGSPLPARDSGPVYRFDPLSDDRWDGFLRNHPLASVFHSSAWLEALRRTHGYDPVAFTTSPPNGELRNAVLFCRVESWLTGRRLVSLPFSDHCDVLTDPEFDWNSIQAALGEELQKERLRSIELRPIRPLATVERVSQPFATHCLHLLDLRPSIGELFSNLHKNSTQRKILRAERDGLTYQEGISSVLLDAFIRLSLLTRRRHGVLPQPINWFRNLIECFQAGLKIRVAYKDRQPVAAILTLRFKDSMVYKYGCSDAQFHSLGGMHQLLWRAIQEAKQDHLRLFDLGRSDWENPGLITFKDRWGAERRELIYSKISLSTRAEPTVFALEGWKKQIGRHVIPHLPDALFRALGRAMYRHFG